MAFSLNQTKQIDKLRFPNAVTHLSAYLIVFFLSWLSIPESLASTFSIPEVVECEISNPTLNLKESGLHQENSQEEPEEKSEEKIDEDIPSARQNSILRNYFRSRYPGVRVQNGIDTFVEDFVDRQIDFFLENIEEDLTELKVAVEILVRLRERLVEQGVDAAVREEGKDAFVGALKRTQDKADDLRDNLSVVFIGLERKGKFKESICQNARENWYRKEIGYIQERVLDAEKRIHAYLFDSRNVVDAKDLNKESMMSCLFYAEQMAKAVRKQITRSR